MSTTSKAETGTIHSQQQPTTNTINQRERPAYKRSHGHIKEVLDFERVRIKDNKKTRRNIIIILTLCLLVLAVTNFLVGVVVIQGSSMYPTIQTGDIVIVNKIAKLKQGDVVIFYDGKTYYAKRLIAFGNQTVDIDKDSGEVSVDGVVLSETYLGSTDYGSPDVTFPLTVPEGKVFLLGDNRKVSLDSRHQRMGMVDQSSVKYAMYLLRITRFS